MAKTLGGARLSRVTKVTTARMSLKLEDHAGRQAESAHATHGMPQSPRASFWAAGLAKIVTRPLDERDHACGNEVVAYPPLSQGVNAQPAYTLGHTFKGQGLAGQLGRPQLPQQLRRSLRPLSIGFRTTDRQTTIAPAFPRNARHGNRPAVPSAGPRGGLFSEPTDCTADPGKAIAGFRSAIEDRGP